MRRAPVALVAALAAALSGCGGPLLFAELQIHSLRATLPSQSFPGSDTTIPANWCTPAQQSSPPCIQAAIDYDLGGMVPILNDPKVTYDLRLTDVAIYLSATQAGTDLTGVQSASVSVLPDPANPATAIVVASYVRPPGAAPAASIGVTGNANVDLGPYLKAGRLPVRVELVLDKPTPPFLADVGAGFSLEVKLDWGKLL